MVRSQPGAGERAIQVVIRWGNSVIGVAELAPPRSFFVGEAAGPQGCDCFLPSEILGTERWPLILVEEGEVFCVVHPDAVGEVRAPGSDHAVELTPDALGRGWIEWPGARRLLLEQGMQLRLQLGSVVFEVRSSTAEARLPRGIAALPDSATAAYFGLSVAFHASLLAAFAFFTPALGLADEEDLDQRRLYLMQQYLEAAAEREQRDPPPTAGADAVRESGSSGARARAEEGAMGNPRHAPANRRYAVAGNVRPEERQLAREAARAEAETFGVIALLQGDPLAPTAPWGRELALGSDPSSAHGQLFGSEIGEAFGAGGLALSGLGLGGGGRGEGIGLEAVGTLGTGSGNCDPPNDCSGFGRGVGRSGGGHVSRAPRIQPQRLTTSGRLPPEVVQRVVRQNFGRFRLCYERGLVKNPNLQGRVAARFVIDRSGAVSSVSNGGSDLPDSAVVSCVISAFYGLSFPQPDNGIVTVVYPIALSPG